MHISKKYNKYSEYSEDINEAVRRDKDDFIKSCEQSYHGSINDIACEIKKCKKASLILLAGPSSAGKTTTGLILISALKELGINAKIISLDDFFYGKGMAPKLADGSFDYESIEALDIPLMHKCFSELLETGKSYFPHFSFRLGHPLDEKKLLELHENDMLIVEGIHALNPIISKNLPNDKLIKLYVSVKQGIKSSDGQVLSNLDIRLLRRIVRDHKFRGSSVENTFSMWEQVCKGEKTNIAPFKREAQMIINSIHMYEPCLMNSVAIDFLKEITPDSKYYIKTLELIGALQLFDSIKEDDIPSTSLLREFIGDSVYYS